MSIRLNAEILIEVSKNIINAKGYLSEIDGLIGDGDHGINMAKGFSLALNNIKQKEITSFSEASNEIADVLFNDIGGSMGPIYGCFFYSLAHKLRSDSCSVEELYESFVFCKDELMSISDAKKGDKTLLDTLISGIESMEANLNSSDSVALNALINGAIDGWESTKEMTAKFGRASRLQERSRGVLDAGATSCKIILCTMGYYMLEHSFET